MKLSLIIPCFNEAANLPALVARCGQLALAADVEVVLVDNGSTDRTPEVLVAELAKHAGCRSIRVDMNQGYGHGILSGLRAATGDILAWTHADMQTDPMDVVKGLAFFQQHGPDILVKGRRHGRPFGDVVFTMGMSTFETLLLRQPMWDINAQPTMFSRRFFDGWDNAPLDFSLDLFAYYEARRQGLPVHRFPVHFGKRLHGVSHWNINWAAKRKFIKRTVDFSLELRKKLKP